MEEKNKKKQIIKISVFITSIFVIFLSVTYAFVNMTLAGIRKQVITTGTLDLVLDEDENNLTISNALPMYDEVGMLQDAFTFRIVNNTTTTTAYTLKLVDTITGDKLDTSLVKYGLTKNGVSSIALLSTLTDGVLDSGTIGTGSIEYALRLWIDSSVTDDTLISGKSLSYKLEITMEQGEVGDTSCPVIAETQPNTPELTSGMIAVTYNKTDKTWVKADTSTNDWYDYSNQIWANAVTVTEDTRDTYMALDAGEPINMDDINTMWVWIPRYSYTIKEPYGRGTTKCSDLGEITISSPSVCRSVEYPTALREEALTQCNSMYGATTEEECEDYLNNMATENGADRGTFEDFIDLLVDFGMVETDTRVLKETYPDNYIVGSAVFPGMIDIKFISKNQKDDGTGKCENCAENWVTPEGFKFDDENISGFWMGKFETSTKEECTASQDSVNTGCDLTILTPEIKPNVSIWRGARVSTFFEASRLMQSSDETLTYNANTYGFDEEGTSSMNVHMLKNSEWGIVAMLSQSKYGKYGNSAYSGANKEVYQNKATYVTGMSNSTPSTSTTNEQVTYDTPDTGYGASTTGTIYGVYDMSGGGEEYVMGNYNNYSGYSGMDSGFCGTNGPTDGTCREWPNAKYYDLYTTDDESLGYKMGDATYETDYWYEDNGFFVESSNPWFVRGDTSATSINAGVFAYVNTRGHADYDKTSRFAIKP